MPWNLDINPTHVPFNMVPIVIQIWGFPLKIKSKNIETKIGVKLGEVLELELFMYLKKGIIIKVKVLQNVTKP